MKNLATWLLAAAFTTAALPAFAVEPSVQVGYSPEGSARVLVLSAIDSAKTSIRMMAYSFTAPDIMKALVAAKKRGVDVKIVIDGVSLDIENYCTLRLFFDLSTLAGLSRRNLPETGIRLLFQI